MKNKLLIVLLTGLLLSVTNVFSQDPNLHIYLCIGQSNMVGAGEIEAQDQVVDSRFQTFQAVNCSNLGRIKANWYTATPPLCRCYDGLNPVDYFGTTMVANLPSNVRVGVITVAVQGCQIELFDKDNFESYLEDAPDWLLNIVNNDYAGNPYQYLIDLANLAKNDGVIKGILLHQGESNYGDTQWPSKVKTVYDDIINDLGLNPASVPLLAGQLAGGDDSYMNSQIISTLPQVIPNAHVVSSNGCEVKDDGIHFTSEGNRELGRHYATEMLSLLGGCTPTSITSYLQVDDGSWQQTASVTVDAGAKVKFGPQPTSGGSWSWSGGGTSGTSREQTIYPTSSVTATATYTNTCGAQSTQNFTVNVNGGVSTTVHLTKRNASGFALDGGNGGANGRQIYLWSNDVNNVNQSWVEIDRGNGYYSYQKLNTDYCIDGGNGGANGQAVILWPCDANNENQHWQKIDAGNSNYRLQKRNSPGYSIDGNNGGANEQGVYLWASDANNENQQWTFSSSSSLKSAIIATEEESISSTEKILAYPNPVIDVLNLQLSVSVNEIAIFSIEGKELYRQNSTSDNVEIDMSDYNPGIYLVKAIGQNETLTQKVLKK